MAGGFGTLAARISRFLGVSDLASTVDAAHRRLDDHEVELGQLREELYRRIEGLEHEQLQLQLACSVWVTMMFLALTPIPEDALVSVIMPTRNRAAVIGRAVGSVLGQSYGNWELVIIDDGSEDDTLEVLRHFDDSRIRVLHHDHRGAAAARNLALDSLTSDYVVYLDDDNVMYAHWLRGVVWAFDGHPETDVMIGAFVIDDIERQHGRGRGANPYLAFRDRFQRDDLRHTNQADMMQLAHRAGLPERFDDDLRVVADWDYLTRLVRDREPLCFPALAGVYTTTASGRLMDSALLREEESRMRSRLRPEHALRIGCTDGDGSNGPERHGVRHVLAPALRKCKDAATSDVGDPSRM